MLFRPSPVLLILMDVEPLGMRAIKSSPCGSVEQNVKKKTFYTIVQILREFLKLNFNQLLIKNILMPIMGTAYSIFEVHVV